MVVVWWVTETRSATGTPTLSAAVSDAAPGAPGRPWARPPGALGRWATAVPAMRKEAAAVSSSGRTGMAGTPVGRSDCVHDVLAHDLARTLEIIWTDNPSAATHHPRPT